MKTLTLDQTASEVQLHRVLYVLKFLRALVVHFFLALMAAALFFFFGFNHAYPLANDTINSLRAVLIQSEIEGQSVGPAVFWTLVAGMVIGALAWLSWIYRSITNVRRFALKFHALTLMSLALYCLILNVPELKFAFEHLNPGFAILAGLGNGIVFLIFPTSIAIGLWGVARAPERSSLLATLDPRLAPNVWVYLNKLLDLPRTPLRTLRTASAYVLAAIGAVLLTASFMFLLTVGGTANKLATLATVCDENSMPNCMAISSKWAREAPFWLIAAFLVVKGASLLQSTAKRLGGLSVSDVIRKSDERFVLYLRAFAADHVVLPKPRLPFFSRLFSFTPFPVRLEQELFDVADGYRPLIAVGQPGEKSVGGVAYRAALDDSQWQDYVIAKIRAAERIVIVLKETEGVRWEFRRVVGEEAVRKTLFLLDPAVGQAEEWEDLERMVLPALREAGMMTESFKLKPHLVGFFFHDGCLVEIINANRTATSYRTAFSHFLAECRD